MQKENEVISQVQKNREVRKFLIIGIISILLVIMVSIVVSVFVYFNSPEKELGLGANIKSFILSEDGKTAYLGLEAGSLDKNISKIKFSFKSDKEYVYETSEGSKNISIPYEKKWHDFLIGPEYNASYDYSINADEIGLNDFSDIKEVSVSFEYKIEEGQTQETEVLDTETTTTNGGGNGGGGGGDGGGGGGGCNPDCSGKECGDDGCGGSCGNCINEKPYCVDYKCVVCRDDNDCDLLNCSNSLCINKSSNCTDYLGINKYKKDYSYNGTVYWDECLNKTNLIEDICNPLCSDINCDIQNITYYCENNCSNGKCLCFNECETEGLFCESGNVYECLLNETTGCNYKILNETCDDSIACTDNSCENAQCVYTRNDSNCEEGYYCNVSIGCKELPECTHDNNCSMFNITEIATCFNNPDNNPLTFDIRDSFKSTCYLTSGKCLIGDDSVISVCNKTNCGAYCENDNDCNCSDTGCYDLNNDGLFNDYIEYPKNGICEESCNCNVGEETGQPCEPILISENNYSKCPPEQCSDCGSFLGFFCDREECEGIGGCYFVDELGPNGCYSCPAICEDYNGDETSCNNDICNSENCSWTSSECVTCVDNDGDDYNITEGCGIIDCDDNVASCNVDCDSIKYNDSDGDDYGNLFVTHRACDAPLNYVDDNNDCDDSNLNVHPGVIEVCNGIDDNCIYGIDENNGDCSAPNPFCKEGNCVECLNSENCNYLDNVCSYGNCNSSNDCELVYNSTDDVCRASTDECDPAEYCSGSSVNCPGDSFLPDYTSCTDDGVSCTEDFCISGICEHNADDSLCDDGLYCNGTETCDSVLDCQPGIPVNCDDGIDCTDDFCNEILDICQNIENNSKCDLGYICNPTAGGCQQSQCLSCYNCDDYYSWENCGYNECNNCNIYSNCYFTGKYESIENCINLSEACVSMGGDLVTECFNYSKEECPNDPCNVGSCSWINEDCREVEEITECKDISASGYYYMPDNIIQTNKETCINIKVKNVTLDCGGNSITSNQNVTGIYSDKDLTVIKNCNISTGEGYGGFGIYILNSKNNFFKNITINLNNYGIYLSSSSNNTFEKITINSGFMKGFSLSSSSNNKFKNIIVKSIPIGFSLSSSSNNIFVNTTLKSIFHTGIKDLGDFDNSDFNNITSCNFYKNRKALSIRKSNILTSNQFIKNLVVSSDFKAEQVTNKKDLTKFNLSMKYWNGSACPSCFYNLKIYPNEDLHYSVNGNYISGNFTPNRVGIYSMIVNITDLKGNTEERKYSFFVNTTKTHKVNYYFRDDFPSYGFKQKISHHDIGSLSFSKPDSQEYIWCAGWVQVSPDELPPYLFGIYNKINYSIWYEFGSSAENNYTGVQRYASIYTDVDKNVTCPLAKGFGNFEFNVNWPSDYFWSWYWTGIKLRGLSPYLYSNSTHPSYANITYIYSDTPAIKHISNQDIQLLSATMLNNESQIANITLFGKGITNISLEMPDSSVSYNIIYDDVDCNENENCDLISQQNGEINLNLILEDKHELQIKESGLLSLNFWGTIKQFFKDLFV